MSWTVGIEQAGRWSRYTRDEWVAKVKDLGSQRIALSFIDPQLAPALNLGVAIIPV